MPAQVRSHKVAFLGFVERSIIAIINPLRVDKGPLKGKIHIAKPTFPLVDIQAAIKLQGRKAFTSTAIATAQDELDMTLQEMIDFICDRTDTECYKTMPSAQLPGVWMDVYQWLCPNKTQMAYVKVSLHPDSKVVISLKEL